MATRYAAGAPGLPFGDSARLRRHRPAEAHHDSIKTIECPFTGEMLAAVPALNPDVGIIHAQRADRDGNVQIWGLLGVQKEAVLASTRSIVTVEEIVDELPDVAGAIVLPSWVVSCGVPRAERCAPEFRDGLLGPRQQLLQGVGSRSRKTVTRSSPGSTSTSSARPISPSTAESVGIDG